MSTEIASGLPPMLFFILPQSKLKYHNKSRILGNLIWINEKYVYILSSNSELVKFLCYLNTIYNTYFIAYKTRSRFFSDFCVNSNRIFWWVLTFCMQCVDTIVHVLWHLLLFNNRNRELVKTFLVCSPCHSAKFL